MSSPNPNPARVRAIIAVLALTLGLPAAGSDLHLADPPSDVIKETTVCNERLLDDTELLAKICTTTWRNSTPGGGQWRHAHVSASVKNVSTRQKPYYLNRVEIVSDAGVVKATCLYKAYLKPNQTANCAEGIQINVGLPNMRIHLEWNMHEV
jgi:hypothetical protein